MQTRAARVHRVAKFKQLLVRKLSTALGRTPHGDAAQTVSHEREARVCFCQSPPRACSVCAAWLARACCYGPLSAAAQPLTPPIVWLQLDLMFPRAFLDCFVGMLDVTWGMTSVVKCSLDELQTVLDDVSTNWWWNHNGTGGRMRVSAESDITIRCIPHTDRKVDHSKCDWCSYRLGEEYEDILDG